MIHIRLLRLAAGISIILLLLSPVWLGGLYLQWQQKQIKRAVKQELLGALPDSALRTFVWPTSSMADSAYWHHDEEFERQDTMYDIVSRQEIGDATILVCWPDQKESAVMQEIRFWSSHLMRRNPATQHQTSKLTMILQAYCLPDASNLVFIQQTCRFQIQSTSIHCEAPYLAVIAPPPEYLQAFL